MTRAWCCGGRRRAVSTPHGVRYVNEHTDRCRVGRILAGPSMQTVPGYEPAPTDDRRQVRSPR